MTTTEKLPRQHLVEVLLATKTKGIDEPMSAALADAIIAGLDRRGLVIASHTDVIDPPDEHLTVLKQIRKTIQDALDEGVAARDLASLTRRQQDVSREVSALEERNRADNKSKVNGNAGSHGRTTGSTKGGSLSL